MMIAVFLSNASISLKSVFSNPFTIIHFHVWPPSILFPTVPLLPLTHRILLSTTLYPLKEDCILSVRISIFCAKINCAENNKMRIKKIFFKRFYFENKIKHSVFTKYLPKED